MPTDKKRIELGIFKTKKAIKSEPNVKKSSEKKKTDETKKEINESKESTKSPEPARQKLFLRRTKANECFAEAKVDKSINARECVQKTLSLEAPRVVRESVSLTVHSQKANKTVSARASPTVSETSLATATTAQLVEQKLNEIAKQAEELAKSIKQAASELPEENFESISQRSSVSPSLYDQTPLQVEIAPPVVKESLTLASPKISAISSPSLSSHPSPKSRTVSPEKKSTEATVLRATQTSPIGSKILETSPPPSPPVRRGTDLRALAEATRSLLEMSSSIVEKSKSQSELHRLVLSNSIDMSRSEIGKEKSKESLADRLSKGLHDLTSSDRLQKWKTKLQTGSVRGRPKDQSEPPPIKRLPMPASMSSEVVLDWTTGIPSRPYVPRPLHPSKSASNALHLNQVNQLSSAAEPMDHRTLKSRENSASQKDLSFHYQNMNSLQKIMNTLDGYSKGVDLPPPARLMPFSGMKPVNDDIIRPIAFRPTGQQEDSKYRQSVQNQFRSDRPVIRGDLAKSASNISHLSSISSSQTQKHRGMFQPSTSFSPLKLQENEYDTVPDYNEKEKLSDFGSSGSDYCYFPAHSMTKLSSSTASSGTTSSSHMSSPPSTNKKPYLGSTGRTSSGVHVTPSPSDSGIVDYETMIRDKENELREVRTTMEQNEEIIVKVYQEKEKGWKEELDHLRARLAASEKGENALRAQLSNYQKQTDGISRTVDGLREEKTGLLRKCFQLERELTQLKLEMDKPRTCDECRQRQKPIPAPRQKDSDSNLRDEVASLREEVATLKEALTGQIKSIADDRKWEREQDKSCRSECSQVSVGRDRLI